MQISDFYSDTNPEIWKKVLGEDLHYHVGWGEGDIMYNSVQYLYQFIQPNSKILDCGCGWAGPAKVIQRDLNCQITGITNSKVQCEYIKNNIPIHVFCGDLQNYKPSEHFDVCLFIESFCHLDDPSIVLKNIHNQVDKIILREYTLKSDIKHCKKYLNKWMMKIYEKNHILEMFELYGFNLDHLEDHYTYSLQPTVDYWLYNLNQLKSQEKTYHIRTLELSSKYLKKNIKEVLNGVELSTFVFKKKWQN